MEKCVETPFDDNGTGWIVQDELLKPERSGLVSDFLS